MYRSTIIALVFGTAAVAAPQPDPVKEPEIPRELLKARLEAVRQVFQAAKHEQEVGRGIFEDLPLWSRRLLEAERALATTKEENVAACRRHLDRMKEFEKIERVRDEAGRVAVKDAAAATYHRTEAEITLARAEAMK